MPRCGAAIHQPPREREAHHLREGRSQDPIPSIDDRGVHHRQHRKRAEFSPELALLVLAGTSGAVEASPRPNLANDESWEKLSTQTTVNQFISLNLTVLLTKIF